MDLRKLKTLIDLVSESNISELEITEPEGKVRIVKAGVAAPMAYALAPLAQAPHFISLIRRCKSKVSLHMRLTRAEMVPISSVMP